MRILDLLSLSLLPLTALACTAAPSSGVDAAVADLATSLPEDLTAGLPSDLLGQADLSVASSADLLPLLPESDTFSATALDSRWKIFHPGVISVATSGGALHITPGAGSLWFNDQQGGAVYQEVTGNFRVSSLVHAHRVGMGNSVAPTSAVHLAGLMARRDVPLGQGGQEDYVFVVVGFDVDDLSVEHKTTVDGVSTYQGPTWAGGGEAELRICRIGSLFRLYKRPTSGGAWTLAATYDRTDLPSTLQVGAVAYSSQASPDLTGSFDSIDFAPVASESDCTN